MWPTRVLSRSVRRTYMELDFAKHVPKEYVGKVKRTVPKKVYTNRYGAPDIVRWTLHPDDYVPSDGRPWELETFEKNVQRAREYHQHKLMHKFFELRHEKKVAIPAEEWTIFPGDLVQVMIGKDKGKTGVVSRVNKETNAIFVKGRHTKLINDSENFSDMDPLYRQIEQPLYVHKGQVKLIDPSDNEPCEAAWVLNEEGNEYIRISKKSKFQIPVPQLAQVTSEYLSPDRYVEVEGKDTPAEIVLEKTYKPVLKSFEEEIADAMGIQDKRKLQPSYWY
ncbi:KOW motif family protein [Brugia malayi]|uniref:Large ribosomal subunit protein uL24m n=1 Tax=Brugia malayi TaxID=6279 RepID=A8NWS8_BRUMA|nr:KOW motif family protein [Brugia malayi]CTP80997.1 BMA-MRPL-24 [Brugia malayi]VIO97246.1 KOW motif family protein [Brugia malayi]